MRDLRNVVQLGGNALHHLALVKVTAKRFDWDSILLRSPNLRVLWLEEVLTWGGTDRSAQPSVIPTHLLGKLPHLRTLALWIPATQTASPLEFLPAAKKLRKLRLFSPVGRSEILAIQTLDSLRSLDVSLEFGTTSQPGIEMLTNLESLAITDSPRPTSERLRDLPHLKQLVLSKSNLRGMGRVPLSSTLRGLVLNDCTAHGTDYFEGHFVERLAIEGGQWEDLSFLRSFPKLQELQLTDMSGLTYADGIRFVPNGCRVEISGVGFLDDSEIDVLRSERRCPVYYEPAQWWGEGQAVS
jgi:hypothetical protein